MLLHRLLHGRHSLEWHQRHHTSPEATPCHATAARAGERLLDDGHQAVHRRHGDLEVIAHGGMGGRHQRGHGGQVTARQGVGRAERAFVLGHDVTRAAQDGGLQRAVGQLRGREISQRRHTEVARRLLTGAPALVVVAVDEAALDLAREKGPAPIMNEEFTVTGEMLRKRPEMAGDGWKIGSKIPGRVLHARYSRYMQRVASVAPSLVEQLALVGARFTHHTSIAPTGTISLSLANNASNGIEPSFAHHYFRNVIREGKKSKEKVDVFSFEMLAYRELVNPRAMPNGTTAADKLPDYFTTADDITPTEHVDIQAASQKWIDSSISKTANVPTDFKYESFKDIYLYAHEKGLKGCTTFRFNPEAFQGVLVKEEDLKNTTYVFTLEDGTEVSVKGDEEIEYDGEKHSAANLYDALKEGYYGKF